MKTSDDSPGPAAFSVDYTKPSVPGYVFAGREPKFHLRGQTPGPGEYLTPTAFDGPSFSLGGRRGLARAKSASPGPGAYNVDTKTSAPSYTISARLSPSKSDSTPGPGAYSPPSRPTSPHHFLATERADRDRIPLPSRSPTPGPGSYTVDAKTEAPCYTFGTKPGPPRSRADATPGPGQYDPWQISHAASRKSNPRPAPAYSLSGRLRSPSCDSLATGENPQGPSPSVPGKPELRRRAAGKPYTLASRNEGPPFTLSSRWKVPIDRAVPGPASHNVTAGCTKPPAPACHMGGACGRRQM